MDTVASPPKRQKLDTEPADEIQDAPGVTWSTRWSDLNIIVPAGPPEKEGPVPLVRIPVHRVYACIFPLLAGILNHPGGSERRSIDMSKEGLHILEHSVTRPPDAVANAGWNLKHWLAIFKFAYDFKLFYLPEPNTLVDEWMEHVGDDPTLETSHLLMYLCRLDLGSYLSENLTEYNPDYGGFALAFCLIHSATDLDSLKIFKESPALIGSQRGRIDVLRELFGWLLDSGSPVDDGVITEATQQQIKICEWLFLTVATTKNEESGFWTSYMYKMEFLERQISAINRAKYAASWFCKFASLLVEFSPCADHMEYEGWEVGNAAEVMHKLHARYDSHICANIKYPGYGHYSFEFDKLFKSANICWTWSNQPGRSDVRSVDYVSFSYPRNFRVLDLWDFENRTASHNKKIFPSHVVSCISTILVEKSAEPVPEQAVQQ